MRNRQVENELRRRNDHGGAAQESVQGATHSASATGMPPVANASGAMNEDSCSETMYGNRRARCAASRRAVQSGVDAVQMHDPDAAAAHPARQCFVVAWA